MLSPRPNLLQLMHIQFTSSAPRCFADTLHTNLNMELYFPASSGGATDSQVFGVLGV